MFTKIKYINFKNTVYRTTKTGLYAIILNGRKQNNDAFFIT